MNTEQQRKEFEEWLATVKYDNSNILSPSNLAWEAWQAAREQVTEQRDAFRKEVEIVNERLRGKKHPDDNGLTVDGEIDIKQLKEQRDRLAEALKLIATWHSYDELHDEVIECEDFAFGYDVAIKISRKALQSLTTNVPHHPRQPGNGAGNKPNL